MQHAVAIVVLIIAGIGSGVFLRRKENVVRLADRAALAAVFALLFLLGLDMGSREDVIGNLGRVGFEAALISLAAMIGSLVVTSLVWTLWYRKGERED